jgi:hypothetical protein
VLAALSFLSLGGARMAKTTPGGQLSQLILGICSLIAFLYLFTFLHHKREYWLSMVAFLALGLYSLAKFKREPSTTSEPKMMLENQHKRLSEKTVTKEVPKQQNNNMYLKALNTPTVEEPLSLSNYSQFLSVPSNTPKTNGFNPIYSPKLAKMKVTDEVSLKKYREVYEQEEAKATAVPQKLIPIPFTSIPYMSGPIPKDIEVKAKSDENFKRISFLETIKKLNISYNIDNWADKLRIWFATLVLKPLIGAIEMYEKLYGSITKVSFQSKIQTNTGSTQPQKPNPFVWSASPTSKPTTSVFSAIKTQNTDQVNPDAVSNFHSIDKYISMDLVQKEELISRIRHLCSTAVLCDYSWDGKRSFSMDNNNRDDEKIADAQILMHLFCAFLDEKVTPTNQLAQDRPFSTEHFAVHPLNFAPDQPIANVVIVQSHRNPPHFDLLINGKELWEIKDGPNNLFYCLVIFIHYFNKNYKGFLDGTWLGPPLIQLLAVVS